MTLESYPKEYINIGGASVTLLGDTTTAREFLPRVRKMLALLSNRNVFGIDQDWMSVQLPGGGSIKVEQRFGRNYATVFVPSLPPPGKGEEERQHEVITRYPAVCHDLVSFEPYATREFVGFYTSKNLLWNPTIFQEADPTRPHGKWDYLNTNPDGMPNQFWRKISFIKNDNPLWEISYYHLDLISEYYGAGSSSSVFWSDGGYFDPGSYPPDDLPEWFAAKCYYGYGYVCHEPYGGGIPFDQVLGEDDGWVYILKPGGPQGIYTYSSWAMVNLYCPHTECPNCVDLGCSGASPVQFGETQTFWWERKWDRTYEIAVEDDIIASGYILTSLRYESEARSYGATSWSRRWDRNLGTSYYDLYSHVVVGVDGYEDYKTYIVTYVEVIYEYEADDIISPWEYWPYFNTYPPEPDASYSERYWAYIKTPYWSVKFEFSPPVWNTSFTQSVYVKDCGIYDFHGIPVFVFSWTVVDDMVNYFCSVYQGNVYISDPFPCDVTYGDYMYPGEVDNSITKFGAYSWGNVRVIGVKETKVEKG